MRSRLLAVSALVLPLALVAGCGDGDDGGGGATGDSARGDRDGQAESVANEAAPCSWLSRESREAVDEALDGRGEATGDRTAVGLLPGEESFIGCGLAEGMLYVGARAFDDGRALLQVSAGSYGSGSYGAEPEPLDGVGDEAYTWVNSYDGLRVTARVGDDLVMVDSRFPDGGDDDATLPRELLIAIAQDLVEAHRAAALPAVELDDACPGVDDELVTGRIGEVRAARGWSTAGAVRCSYAGAESFVTIGSQQTDPGLLAMGLGDAGPAVPVDGGEVYLDRDTATLVAGETCAVVVEASPFGWTLVGASDEAAEQAALVELAEGAFAQLGCVGD